jgi:hypothetical protein
VQGADEVRVDDGADLLGVQLHSGSAPLVQTGVVDPDVHAAERVPPHPRALHGGRVAHVAGRPNDAVRTGKRCPRSATTRSTASWRPAADRDVASALEKHLGESASDALWSTPSPRRVSPHVTLLP